MISRRVHRPREEVTAQGLHVQWALTGSFSVWLREGRHQSNSWMGLDPNSRLLKTPDEGFSHPIFWAVLKEVEF